MRKTILSRTIKVMTNDLRVGKSPDVLYTKGIGSCVAIALYDTHKRIGGLAHISLPAKVNDKPEANLHRYAKIAIDSLLKAMEGMGGSKTFIVATIVGGGNMFGFTLAPINDIGRLNVVAVRDALRRHQLPIIGEEVLGTEGRNVFFNLENGVVKVTVPGSTAGLK